ESNGWKRTLGFMSDENILMKTRLFEILQGNFDITLLPRVENFHSLLLKEEEFINLLRHNMAELDYLLVHEHQHHRNIAEIDFMHSRLKYQMMTAETRFKKLESEFYDFLSLKD
ncbi:MAG: hypothetical protein ABIQ11_07520, partial [Saprospiraceae bacterium]